MSRSRFKAAIFALEATNSVATTLYFYYAYFFMQQQFGFGPFQNLLLAALLGLIYTFAAIYGGRFAQRHSCMISLRLGFFTMAAALLAGSQLRELAAHISVLVIATVGMCFTWPALQAMASDGGASGKLQKYVGIYNFTWASGSAVAFFLGGAMIERFGMQSIFLVPGAIHLLQFLSTFVLREKTESAPVLEQIQPATVAPMQRPRDAALFLKMAWLANPFAYLAINTVVAITPTLAKKLELSPKYAGFICSVWFFVRAGSFILLWLWPKWHYRFGWLAGAFAGLVASFAVILLVSSVAVLVVAQVVFGIALGLIYYSSLFYSMDVSETKAKHGGIHEAAIGVGCCAGPAIGAAALHFFPHQPNSGAFAVSLLLMCGLAGLFWLRSRRISIMAQRE